jgi:hypothetical protein
MPLPFDSQSLSTDYNRPSNLLRIAHPNSHVQIQLLISSCRHAAKFEAFSGNKVLRHEHQHSRSCALIPVSFRILRQERITPSLQLLSSRTELGLSANLSYNTSALL